MRSLVIVSILSVLIVLNIQTSIPPVYAEKQIEPVIVFDKQAYSPYAYVHIKIIYPHANTDPEETDRFSAKIFTTSGNSTTLTFIEAYGEYPEHDTGVFESWITLTPNIVEWEGQLQVQKGDSLVVEFTTKDNKTFTKKADVNFNLGTARFNKDAFSSREEVEIFVSDPDRNSKDDVINTLPVRVWSTTDRSGIMVTLRETDADSGEFHEFITLTRNQTSSGTRLRVSDGDTITLRYTDNTLIPTGERSPKGFETFAVQEFFASALISDCFCPPLERAFMEDPQILSPIDKLPISVTQLHTGDTAIIRTAITNWQYTDNQIAYIMQIKSSDNVVVSLSWIRSELRANETMKAESAWIPESPDTYTIELFIWTDIDKPEALGPVRTTSVEVR